MVIFNKDYQSRHNYTLFPQNNFSDFYKNKLSNNYDKLSNKDFEELRDEILQAYGTKKATKLQAGHNSLYSVYFSYKNSNNSNNNKTEYNNKLSSEDLIEHFINLYHRQDTSGKTVNYLFTIYVKILFGSKPK